MRPLHGHGLGQHTVDALDVTTPFGGFRQSGFGRDFSLHTLLNYTGLKTTWFNNG